MQRESLYKLFDRNMILRTNDMIRSVAHVIGNSVLKEESKEIDTVIWRRDETIRFLLHLLDGSMLKDHMKLTNI